MALIVALAFQDCFTAWVPLMPKLADQGEIVPLDGKTHDTDSGQAAIHMVHLGGKKSAGLQFHCEEA